MASGQGSIRGIGTVSTVGHWMLGLSTNLREISQRSELEVHASAFTIKNLLRHYAECLNMVSPHEIGMLVRKNDNGQPALRRIFKNQTARPAFKKEKVLLRALHTVKGSLTTLLDTGHRDSMTSPRS